MGQREDEQAFAELNAQNPILLKTPRGCSATQLQQDERGAISYRRKPSGKGPCNSHDAVSILDEAQPLQ